VQLLNMGNQTKAETGGGGGRQPLLGEACRNGAENKRES